MFLLIEFTQNHNTVAVSPLKTIHKGGWFEIKNQSIAVKLKDRPDYPGTFCGSQPDGDIFLGYGPYEPKSDQEFLHIWVTKNGTSLTIKRDVFCTLPLYYGFADGIFVASNDFKEVVSRIPKLTLNLHFAAKILLNVEDDLSTIWNEIHILGERQTLQYTQGKPKIITPSPRPWAYNSELNKQDAKMFPAVLRNRFNNFVQSRLSHGKVGFELSGGLDSSFLPLFMKREGYNLHSYAGTLIQPAHHTQQSQKIDELEQQTNLHSKRILLDPNQHYPLVNMISTGDYYPLHLIHEIYEPGIAQIADHLSEHGVQVVVTGAGGDQLLEHRPHPSIVPHKKAAKDDAPSFVTIPPNYIPQEAKDLEPLPTPLSSTTVKENLAHANIYIERDIWPVSPFYDVELFNFCQALPIQFRANKNIYRAYFEASNFPFSIYRGPNENFDSFFESCLLSTTYQHLIKEFSKNSTAHNLNLINAPDLLQTYHQILHNDSKDNALFIIYMWLVMEIDIAITKQQKT